MTFAGLCEAARAALDVYAALVQSVEGYTPPLPFVQQRRLIGERPAWADYVLQLEADEKLCAYQGNARNDVECNAAAVRQLRGADAYLAARVQPEPPRAA